MTAAQVQRFKRRLLALRKRLGGDLTELEEEVLQPVGGETAGGISDVPVHPADLGTDNFEEELSLTLMENQQQILQDIEDALERIEQGTFGRCEECQREIPIERLEAVPYTRYCIQHARQYVKNTKL